MIKLTKLFLIVVSLISAVAFANDNNLEFRLHLDEDLIALQILRGGRDTPASHVEELRRKIRTAYPSQVSQIENIPDQSFSISTARNTEFARAIAKTKQSPEFRQILEEVRLHLEEIKEYTRLLTGEAGIVQHTVNALLKFPLRGRFDLYVLSPQFPQGYNFGDRKLAYGSRKFYEYDAIVYIVHECLHSYLESDETSHAVIELAANYELRKQLLSMDMDLFSSIDFTASSVGSPSRTSIRQGIYDNHWQEYTSSGETLIQFAKRMSRLNFD